MEEDEGGGRRRMSEEEEGEGRRRMRRMRRQDEEGGRRRRRRKREEEDLCFEPRRGGGRWAKALKRTRCEPHLEVNVLRKSADGRTGARRAEDQKSVAIQRPSFCCAPTWSTSCKSDSETSPPSSGGGRTAKDSCSCLPLSSCLSPSRVLYAERFQCCRIPCSTNCSCCRAGIQEILLLDSSPTATTIC